MSHMRSQKKVMFLALAIAIFFSFVPFEFAQAGLGSTITNAILNVVLFIPEKVLGIVADLLEVMFGLLAKALAVLIGWILGVTVTPGLSTTPKFVTEAWNTVRQLVNIFFILILTFIGLATILRLQNYQLQKTLPLLLIVALLVNFSGVFVGFIVDITNLVANFFIQEAANPAWDELGKGIAQVPNVSDKSTLQALAKHIVDIIFYLVAILIYFIVMLVVSVRVMFLWVFVILSPIAFTSYILPATRGYVWNQWWQQLTQWSIFIIPLSFFLWLASKSIGFDLSSTPGGTEANWFASMLVPFTTLLLLYLGVTTSQQMAPAAARAVADFGKKWGTRAGLGAGSAAWRFQGGKVKIPGTKGKEFGLRLEKGLGPSIQQFGGFLKQSGTTVDAATRSSMEQSINKRVADKQGVLTTISASLAPQDIAKRKQLNKEIQDLEKERENLPRVHAGGVGKITAVPAFLARWAGRGLELGAGEITMRMKAKDEREIGEGRSQALNKDSADNIIKINQELAKGTLTNMNRIVGLLNGIVANGDSDDLQTALRDGILSGKEVGRALLAAQRGGPPSYRPIAKALYGKLLVDPEQFGFSVTERDEKGIPIKYDNDDVTRMVREVPEKLTTSDIANKILGDTIDKGKAGGREFVEFGGEIVLKQLIEIRGGDLASTLIRRPETRPGRQAIMEVLRTVDPTDLHEQGADGLIQYLSSNAAQGAGIVSPLLPNETNELLRLLRESDRTALSPQDQESLKRLIQIWLGVSPPPTVVPPVVPPGGVTIPWPGGVPPRFGTSQPSPQPPPKTPPSYGQPPSQQSPPSSTPPQQPKKTRRRFPGRPPQPPRYGQS